MQLVISKVGQGRSTYLLNEGISLTKEGKEVRIYCDDSLAGELFKRLQQDGTADMSKIEIHDTADLKAVVKHAVESKLGENEVIIIDGNQTIARELLAYPAENVIYLPLIIGAQVSPMTCPEGITTYSGMDGYVVIQNRFEIKNVKDATLYTGEASTGARPMDMVKALESKVSKSGKASRSDFIRANPPTADGEYKCAVCGKMIKTDDMQVDYITPISKGGSDSVSNLRAVCATCNQRHEANEKIQGGSGISTDFFKKD